jgi:hypothetical protein
MQRRGRGAVKRFLVIALIMFCARSVTAEHGPHNGNTCRAHFYSASGCQPVGNWESSDEWTHTTNHYSDWETFYVSDRNWEYNDLAGLERTVNVVVTKHIGAHGNDGDMEINRYSYETSWSEDIESVLISDPGIVIELWTEPNYKGQYARLAGIGCYNIGFEVKSIRTYSVEEGPPPEELP